MHIYKFLKIHAFKKKLVLAYNKQYNVITLRIANLKENKK
jgi:hypothetical protein